MKFGTIDTPVPRAESGAGCSSANAFAGVGRQAHAVRVSATDGDVDAGRNSGQPQARVPVLPAKKGRRCESGIDGRTRWSGMLTSPAAAKPNERWSVDFVSDCVSSGTVIRLLTIVDDRSRACTTQNGSGRKPAIEVDISLGALTGGSSAGSDFERARVTGGNCSG